MEEFEKFVKNLELNLVFFFSKNPYLTVVFSDLNANSHNWYKGGETATSESEIMASRYGLTQMIN